jgi:hypothetical protein
MSTVKKVMLDEYIRDPCKKRKRHGSDDRRLSLSCCAGKAMLQMKNVLFLQQVLCGNHASA